MLKSAILLLATAALVSAKTLTYNWNIGWVTRSPDGFSRPVMAINGQWPCPTIEATVGDRIIVNAYNSLGNETTSLHFHGISQKGSNFMDGPSSATQCPIPPGSSFKYDFVVTEPGAYWYHSHTMAQYPDGLRGPLIVKDPDEPCKGQFDEELILTTSDWYHDQAPVLIQKMFETSNTHFLPPFPDSLLLNDGQHVSYNFRPGKTYKIHIISMAAFASTFIQFDSHMMRVIAIDGSYVQKHDAAQLRVAPAQRYTILLTALKATTKNYAFLASLDQNRDFKDPAAQPPNAYPFNITGYLMYDNNKPLPAPLVVSNWDPLDDATLVADRRERLFGKPDKTIVLNFQFKPDDTGIPRSYFNDITYVPQKVPTLYTAISTGKDNTDPSIYGAVNPFIVKKNQIVEIQINNLDAAIHPFHLHGHQFQIAERPASNKGIYNGDSKRFPSKPASRDTISVNANSYAVLRFKADNPGIQLFHCHIDWHVEMGLTATIIEAPEELRGLKIPADHLKACQAQGLPTSGNAAGNTKNVHDLTGANTVAPINGALYNPATGGNLTTRSGRR